MPGAGPIASAYVEIVADTGDFRRQLQRDLKGALGNSGRQAGRQAGKQTATHFTDAFGRTVPKLTGKQIRKGLENSAVQRSGRIAGSQLGQSFVDAFARVLRVDLVRGIQISAALGPPLAALGGVATTLAAQLAPLVGLFAGLPAVMAGAAASIGTLKVAFLGMGDAFKAALGDDPDKFRQAIEGLAPAAQQAARALRDLREPLDGLRDAVQQAFFSELVGSFGRLRSTIAPIRQSMVGLSTAFGQIANDVLRFATSAQSMDALQLVFAGLTDAVQSLRPVVGPVLGALRQLVLDIAPLFRTMAKDVRGVGKAFASWVQSCASSSESRRTRG